MTLLRSVLRAPILLALCACAAPLVGYRGVGGVTRYFSQARDPGLWTTLKAALWPTASVLHVVGFRGPPAGDFRASEILEVALPSDGFERLVRYIHDAHDRAGAAAGAPLGPGLYGDSWFYPAWGGFPRFRP